MWQIDLIDMQSQSDKAYKFILNCQDHLTKFVRLVPLKSKTANEVAEAVLSIMLVQGACNIIHSDNGREFSNQVSFCLSQFGLLYLMWLHTSIGNQRALYNAVGGASPTRHWSSTWPSTPWKGLIGVPNAAGNLGKMPHWGTIWPPFAVQTRQKGRSIDGRRWLQRGGTLPRIPSPASDAVEGS